MHEGNMDHLVTALKAKLTPFQLNLLVEALEDDSTLDTLILELTHSTQKARRIS